MNDVQVLLYIYSTTNEHDNQNKFFFPRVFDPLMWIFGDMYRSDKCER